MNHKVHGGQEKYSKQGHPGAQRSGQRYCNCLPPTQRHGNKDPSADLCQAHGLICRELFIVIYLFLGDKCGALAVCGVVGEVVRKSFGSIPRWLTWDAIGDLWRLEQKHKIKNNFSYKVWDNFQPEFQPDCEQPLGKQTYLQVGDGGFVSFHLDDGFCSQVLLPVKDR